MTQRKHGTLGEMYAHQSQEALVLTVEGKLPASWHFLPLPDDEGLGNA